MEPSSEAKTSPEITDLVVADILQRALPVLTVMAGAAVVVSAVSFAENPLRIVSSFFALVMCIVCWLMLRRGHRTVAIRSVMGTLVVASLFAMIFNGGMRAPGAVLMLPLIAMVGWARGRSAATLATVGTVATYALVGALTKGDLLRTPPPPAPLVHAGFMSVYAWIIWVTTAYPQDRLRMALATSFARERALVSEQSRRQASERALTVVFNHTTQLMLLTSPSGVLLGINPTALRFLGLSEGQGIGTACVQLPGWLPAERTQLAVALEQARTHRVNLRLTRPAPTGDETFEFALTPHFDASGVIDHIVIDGRDITGILEEEEIASRGRRLELVGQLAGGVAHDFNNVLAAIVASAVSLRDELQHSNALSEDSKACLDSIESVGLGAGDLTRRLLNFARRAPVEPKPTSLHQLLESILRLVSRTLDTKIAVTTDFAAAHDEVLADAASIESMVLNLAINARDAMPNGGKLHVATTLAQLDEARAKQLEVDPGAYLCVDVRDTGTGIDPALLGRIFEPFFTTKPVGQGTGIGLASVFGAVRLHKGAIEVQSEVGRGTTFRLLFPLLRSVQGTPSIAA